MYIASVFHDLIVQPIFNLLVAIYALLPGHDFGIAIIVFTIIVRLLMWPLIKKQLHQTKAMQKLQPQLKRIKEQTKGNKQKEQLMIMELYKERGISPFGSLGTIVVQFVILIGLYVGLRHVVDDPKAIIDNSYNFIRNIPWMQSVQDNLTLFKDDLQNGLLGAVDLSRAALQNGKPLYWPAMLLVIGSAVAQYFVSVQLMPKAKDARTLRQVFRDASEGKQTDQSEVSAAVGRSFRFFIPAMIFLFTVNLPAALSLYWLVGGVVAYIQQARILGQDEEEMEAIADKSGPIIEGEVVTNKKSAKAEGSTTTEVAAQRSAKSPASKANKSAKRRKKK